MNELQNTLETLRTCLRMLTFCELVSSLILPMTNSALVRGEVKFGGAIFWTGFSSSLALVRFVCTLHVLSIGVLRTLCFARIKWLKGYGCPTSTAILQVMIFAFLLSSGI